jgi:hypothetical protein
MLPPKPGSSERSLSFRLSSQNFVPSSRFPHACCIPHLGRLPWFDRRNNISEEHTLWSSTLYSFLQPRHSMSSGFGLWRKPPDREDSWEYTEWKVADSQQGVVLQLKGWARGRRGLTSSYRRRTSMLRRQVSRV